MIYLFWIKGLRVIVCGGILEIFFLIGDSYDVIFWNFFIMIRNLLNDLVMLLCVDVRVVMLFWLIGCCLNV